MFVPFLIAFFVSAAFALGALGIALMMRARDEHRRIISKIAVIDEPDVAQKPDVPTQDSGLKQRFEKLAHSVGNRIGPKDEAELSHMQTMFLQAGLRSRNAVAIFFGLKVLVAALLLICFLLYRLITIDELSMIQVTTVAILITGIGFYLPNFWLNIAIARRREKMVLGFPEALDLLVVCAEAGMGLDGALKRVGEEMRLNNRVVSDEFRTLNLELRAGKSRRDALRNLATRAGLEDVNSLITLLIQTDRFGTSVAQALRVHADSMRTKRTQRVEEIAAKLPVKLLFPTIFCIFPSLFLVILGPALIQVFRMWGR